MINHWLYFLGMKKMEYKTRQWHEKCFLCNVCKNPIGTKSFIPKEHDIYCAKCYEDKFATKCTKCSKVNRIQVKAIFFNDMMCLSFLRLKENPRDPKLSSLIAVTNHSAISAPFEVTLLEMYQQATLDHQLTYSLSSAHPCYLNLLEPTCM